MDEKDREWSLWRSGMKDTPEFRAAIAYLNVFPLWEDSKAHIVTHSEYTSMVAKGEIDEPKPHWQIREGEVGIVHRRHYCQFSTTWEKISTCMGDFIQGWLQCEKFHAERLAPPPPTVTITHDIDGEYRVPSPDKRPEAAYFTSDKEDAEGTARQMYGQNVQIKHRYRRHP
jgi:hypothetical protein